MSGAHWLEALLVRGLFAAARGMGWRRSLAAGERLGELAHALGLRRRVAEDNLARAFPSRTAEERSRLLAAHYRELGRVCVEYARLAELASAAPGEAFAEVLGIEHLERAAAAGRGAILMSGHFGNFELVGGKVATLHPVDFVVRALSNARVEALVSSQRAAAGVGEIPADRGLRRIYRALKANRWVAMLADQDARREGVFVPFFGRPASTPLGPARIALATGAPIIMGFDHRVADGRHVLEVSAPLEVPDAGAPDAALRLTAAHTAALERRVREHPESWFWLHRRWKTAPEAV